MTRTRVHRGRDEHPPVRRPDDPAGRRRRLRRRPQRPLARPHATSSSGRRRRGRPDDRYVGVTRGRRDGRGVHRQDEIRRGRGRRARPRADQGARARPSRWTASPATTGSATRSPTRGGRWTRPSPAARSTRAARTSSARGCGSCGRTTPSETAADAEIDRLRDFYELHYPDVAKRDAVGHRRGHRRDQGPLPADRDARDEGDGVHLPEQPRPHRLPRLLPLPRRRPLPRRERGGRRRRRSRRAATRATRSPRSAARSPACRWASRPTPTTTALWVFNHRDVAPGTDPGRTPAASATPATTAATATRPARSRSTTTRCSPTTPRSSDRRGRRGLRLLPPAGLLRPLPQREGPARQRPGGGHRAHGATARHPVAAHRGRRPPMTSSRGAFR